MTENPSSITPGQFIELQSFAISSDGFLFIWSLNEAFI